LIITANVVVGRSWASHAIGILSGLTAGATFLFGALYFTGILAPPSTAAAAQPLGVGIMVTAAIAVVVASNPVRSRIAGFLGMDPNNPVHVLALVLAVIWLGSNIAIVSLIDVLAVDKAQPPLTIVDLLANQVPFLIIAVTGVGLYIRRNPTEVAVRLGVVRPVWWQITLALAAAGLFVAFAQATVALSNALTPQIAHNIDVTTQHDFGGLLGSPIGIASLALLPAICEEILFRGALQPRLGLVLTALLFASIHSQYSISFDTLAVFVLGLGLGFIRKYTNTTTSSICHATYNLVVAIGVGDLIGLAIAAEVVLAAVTSFALWSRRRRTAAVTIP